MLACSFCVHLCVCDCAAVNWRAWSSVCCTLGRRTWRAASRCSLTGRWLGRYWAPAARPANSNNTISILSSSTTHYWASIHAKNAIIIKKSNWIFSAGCAHGGDHYGELVMDSFHGNEQESDLRVTAAQRELLVTPLRQSAPPECPVPSKLEKDSKSKARKACKLCPCADFTHMNQTLWRLLFV